MRPRGFTKLAVSVSIAGLCLGFLLYFWFSISRDKDSPDFDLFTLVPQSSIAVVETDRMDKLVHDINDLPEANVDSLMNISNILVLLRSYLQPLLSETPHGFSREMDNVLISFHKPGTKTDQVMYCCLNDGDIGLIKNSLLKYFPSNSPSETYNYEGSVIEKYSWQGTEPIYATYSDAYLVLSFNKALIEEVIDTKKKNISLLKEKDFAQLYHQSNDEMVRLYVKNGTWNSFGVRVGERAVYLLDLNSKSDSLVRFFDLVDLNEELEKPSLLED